MDDERVSEVSTQQTRLDDVRVSEVCSHTHRCPHRQTTKVDDERVSEACPHRLQEWMMRGFLRLVHTTNKTG